MSKKNLVVLHGMSLNCKSSISEGVDGLIKVSQSTSYLWNKFDEYKNQGLNPIDFVLIKLGLYNTLDPRHGYLIEKGIIENIFFNTLMNDPTKQNWKGLDAVFTEEQVHKLIEEENRLFENFDVTRVLVTTHNRDFLYKKLVGEDNALRNQIFDCSIDLYLEYQERYFNMVEKYHHPITYHFKLEELDADGRFDLSQITNLLQLF